MAATAKYSEWGIWACKHRGCAAPLLPVRPHLAAWCRARCRRTRSAAVARTIKRCWAGCRTYATHHAPTCPLLACTAVASTCDEIATALDSIAATNTTAKPMAAAIKLDCGGTYTNCSATLNLRWSKSAPTPPKLSLTITAGPGCKKGDKRPLISTLAASLSHPAFFYSEPSMVSQRWTRRPPGRSCVRAASSCRTATWLRSRGLSSRAPRRCRLLTSLLTATPHLPTQAPTTAAFSLTLDSLRFDCRNKFGALMLYSTSGSLSSINVKVQTACMGACRYWRAAAAASWTCAEQHCVHSAAFLAACPRTRRASVCTQSCAHGRVPADTLHTSIGKPAFLFTQVPLPPDHTLLQNVEVINSGSPNPALFAQYIDYVTVGAAKAIC